MAQHMQDQIAATPALGSNLPDGIEILPDIVPLIDILLEVGDKRTTRLQGALGQNAMLNPALFDLKRMGPHFAVVGSPLSGKTTTLYNWVLSLTYRHSPQQVMLLLVDLQSRFVMYGGEKSLADLPHVVTAVHEAEELEALLPTLKNECEALTQENNNRELFIIIDNFDDFVEETERMREVPRELAAMARRYGREGLHFIVAGSLDSSSALRQRIKASNYGIGLRTSQSINTLGVIKTPPALRGEKELPNGRGFIVRSGYATLLQVASPYQGEGIGEPLTGEMEEDEERVAQALDTWVDMICQKHKKAAKVEWSQPLPGAGADGAAVDSQTKPVIDLLKRIIYKQKNGQGAEIANWDDTAVLRKFVEDALKTETGMDDLSLFGTTAEEIFDAAEGYFPELPQEEADKK
jgi:hypothetical protein